MGVYVQRPLAPSAWAEGAWAEVLATFGAEDYTGQEDVQRILVQPRNGRHVRGESSLIGFQHPENAVYVFGPDMGHLQKGEEFDHSVYVPQLKTNVTLWSHQAAAIVLYDRMLKHGNSRQQDGS